MKKVLVTGATGFIGDHLMTQLIKKDVAVIASSSNLSTAREKAWYSRVAHVPFDMHDYDAGVNYFEYFDKPDMVIHLAWEGLPNYKELFHFEKNLPVHYRFLKNLIEHGLADLTVTGTCFEYGMQEGALSEDMPTFPDNPYALAKDTLNKFLIQLRKKQSFNFKWVRLFYMYGKGQNPNSLLSQLEQAIQKGDEVFNMSGGEQWRDYLPVEEVARNIIKIALQQEVSGTINCCSGQPISVKNFVEQYLKEKAATIRLNTGYYPYPDYEPMRFWGDNTKLKLILNNE